MGTAVALLEHPILFTPANVRLILDGHKTQTRRVVMPQPSSGVRTSPFVQSGLEDGHGREIRCPHGKPGDRLWVRERFARDPDGAIYYAADGDGKLNHWTPSIHMPRWACRLTLEITEIKVDRVQDINIKDSRREGCHSTNPVIEYHALWDSINAKRGYGWDVNPWVWAITFRRVA